MTRETGGGAPDMADWLSTLSLMTTYSKYFSADEIKRIISVPKELQLQRAHTRPA